MTLADLGWNPHFELAFERLDRPRAVPARVARVERTLCRVLDAEGALLDARLPGRHRASPPAVGDWVALARGGPASPWAVADVLPRRTQLARKAAGDLSREQVVAANVDVAFLVAGLDLDVNVRRLERYVAVARAGGVLPAIVLNKADAATGPEAAIAEARRVAPDVEVLLASARDGIGLDALRARVPPGATAALLGPSGVGKSTLANRLLGSEAQATGAVRGDGKGRHTTTGGALLPLPAGGVLLDTPGLREIGLADAAGVGDVFAEVEALARACRFSDCGHASEPGCAVRAAIEDGALAADRFDAYASLLAEARRAAVRRSEAARAEARREARSWGKMGRDAQAAKRAKREGR